MTGYIDEAQVEIVTVDYFHELGYEYIHGPMIAPDGEAPDRQDHAQVVLLRQYCDTLLPRLLSGEIELPAAEAQAEEVSS